MLLIDTTFLVFGGTGISSVINQLLEVFDEEKIEYRKISYFDFYPEKIKKNWYLYFNKILLNEVKKLSQNDIFLFPENLGGLIYFKRLKCKTIFMLHDLFEMRSNNRLSYLFKKLRFKFVLYRVNKIITVSNCSRDEILKEFPALSQAVTVLYPFYVGRNIYKDSSSTENVVTEESLTVEKYILANGSGQERKNTVFLLKFANQIYKDFGLRIVLFGRDFHNNGYRNIKESISHYNCSDKVIQFGSVSDEKLISLYTQATCFVFPSLDEGFGLPPVEALVSNCRIAVSNIPIFKEILSPLNRFFDFTYESLSENLHKVLEMSESEFTSERTAILEKFQYENYKNTLFKILFE